MLDVHEDVTLSVVPCDKAKAGFIVELLHNANHVITLRA